MKLPTILKKMKLNSVDFVKRGANPEAHIMIHKSADYTDDEVIDVAKAEDDLTMFADVLGESFSNIMKDDTLTDEERVLMVAKSVEEFNDTLGDYISSLGILEKSNPGDPNGSQTAATQKSILRKGEQQVMAKYENVDKSLLSPEESAMLDALMKKASATETDDEVNPQKKVDPATAKKEAEKAGELPPEVKKALEEVETLKKSYEMKELENVAKKYEILGKKTAETAQTLYDLKKSGEANYNAYIAALDAQVDLVEKSGMFTEIGKSGGRCFSTVAKSEAEANIEAIAKGYMEKDPDLDYNDAVAKAWMQNPDLVDAYEKSAGF